MAFEARYSGRCGDCGGTIKPGQLVRYDGDKLVHDDCDGVTVVATELDRDAQREVCTSCFILKPCPCQDGV